MELDPPYCDVIVKRWEEFTGKKAERLLVKDSLPGAITGDENVTSEGPDAAAPVKGAEQ
jgi:hypothetical protein